MLLRTFAIGAATALAAVASSAAAVAATPQTPATETAATETARSALPIVPAYFDPSTSPAEWNRLINTTPPGGMFVFSVGNLGPGPVVDPTYLEVVQRAQAKGIKAICYVETLEGDGVTIRPLADAKTDIDRCFNQYQPDGIFLDEVGGTAERYAGVAELSTYIDAKDPDAIRILNAGQDTTPEYINIGEILAIFEGPWKGSPVGYNFKDWTPAQWVTDWIAQHPGGQNRFWYMSYATSAADMPAAVQRGKQLGGGYLYVTDGRGDPRWDHLPAYWENELAALR